ncbi:hypothetical protein E4T56_gene905 [Termitomyces sp. T112]|nr:hypothetical protein E4T56_gene905 [Termitomyces sp. T112]
MSYCTVVSHESKGLECNIWPREFLRLVLFGSPFASCVIEPQPPEVALTAEQVSGFGLRASSSIAQVSTWFLKRSLPHQCLSAPCAPSMTQPTPSVQLTQASLTSHTTELSGLCQTTEAVSLSLQALLECLPLAPTLPPGPPAAAARFSSAPSLEVLAPHSKLPHSVLPDIFDGDHRVGKCFLQSCITYIQLSSEAFASDALEITWVLSSMKAG